MNIQLIAMLVRMGIDINVLKNLVKIYSVLKEDENFTIKKYSKLISNIIKGEKIIKYEDKYILSTFLPPFPSKAFYNNILAVPSKNKIFTQQMYAKRLAPISMYLCLTQRCPNKCLYCSAKERTSEYELTTTEWITIIKDLQKMKTPIIGLTGGDPMIRDDIYDIVKSIDDRSSSILFTSGFNLTFERAKELKKSGLFGIGISLDSYDKNIHNNNRNSDKAFDFALKAINNASTAGLYTMVQTVVIKKYLEEEALFKLFRLAKEQGANEVKLLEPVLSGKLLKEENLKLILFNNEDRKKLIKIMHKANKSYRFPKITSFAYTESKEKFGCGAGTQHSYISANGHLHPCDFIPMDFGNVRERSIIDLWQEMNQIIGNPKIGCFAQKINKKVYKESEGRVPLNKNLSQIICKKNRSDTFPDYYKSMQ